MASAELGWWLGAAPGFAIALRTWWKGIRLQSRLSSVALADRNWSAADLSHKQMLGLWADPTRFISENDSPAVVEAKKAIVAFRPRALWGMWGGGILAFAGGVIGSLIAGGTW